MSARTPGVFTVRAATPSSATFCFDDRLPHYSVRYGDVRLAKRRCETREVVSLGGARLVESDVDALLKRMHQAQTAPDDICDDCQEPTTGTALCEPCAQRRYVDRIEKLHDRAQEWSR